MNVCWKALRLLLLPEVRYATLNTSCPKQCVNRPATARQPKSVIKLLTNRGPKANSASPMRHALQKIHDRELIPESANCDGITLLTFLYEHSEL